MSRPFIGVVASNALAPYAATGEHFNSVDLDVELSTQYYQWSGGYLENIANSSIPQRSIDFVGSWKDSYRPTTINVKVSFDDFGASDPALTDSRAVIYDTNGDVIGDQTITGFSGVDNIQNIAVSLSFTSFDLSHIRMYGSSYQSGYAGWPDVRDIIFA